ncbi:MAG: nicotinate-nucleotide diphosphorylase (carboxylating), partial [Thermodesulfovibrionales bacterium]
GEVEVENLNDLKEAVEGGADIVMLDNMSVENMKEAVKIARGIQRNVIIEASGNVTLNNVREIAETGVDLISIGALTHSATAADISMKIVR